MAETDGRETWNDCEGKASSIISNELDMDMDCDQEIEGLIESARERRAIPALLL